MINFRYHVVSLTAVFLALAIGLVLGTAALNGPVTDNLYDQVRSLGKTNSTLRDQVDHLEEEVDKQEEFVRLAAPTMLKDKLINRRVAVVTMPGADTQHVKGVTEMLGRAGAKVTSQLQFTDDFTDPAKNEDLLDLAQSSLPTGLGGGLPNNGSGVETSAALLAAVLLDRAPPLQGNGAATVLEAYQKLRLITMPGKFTGPAEAVLVVTGQPAMDRTDTERNAAVLTAVEQFDKAAPIVLVSPNVAGDGNTVAGVRDDPTLSKTISTVDNCATVQGQLVSVLALEEQLAGNHGHYGLGTGAQALMPKLTS